jgi:hypothetical protein
MRNLKTTHSPVYGVAVLTFFLISLMFAGNSYGDGDKEKTFARQPVNFEASLLCDAGGCGQGIFNVPANKLFVIETVSATVFGVTLGTPGVAIIADGGGAGHQNIRYNIPVSPGASSRLFLGTLSARIYALPGTSVGIQLDRPDSEPGEDRLDVGFSGYLLPVGSATLSP